MDYVRDPTGLRGLLLSHEVQQVCVDAAERGAAYLTGGAAPVRTGEYRDGIQVEPGMSPKSDRVGARLVATAPHSAAVEFRGSGPGPLRSAIPVMEGRV